MPEIIKPLTFEDLPTRPPLVGRPKISDDIQQTAALLVGWDKSTRRLVYVNPSGVLHTAEPPVKAVINITAPSTGYTWYGDDIKTSEVIVKAHIQNGNRVWVNVGDVAASNVGFPLDAGEWLKIAVNNLAVLHLFFDAETEKAIILYTK